MTAQTESSPDAGGTPSVRVPPVTRAASPLRPGWPLSTLLLGMPVFWVLGLANVAMMILAVPMVIELIRRRPIRLPRGFMLWALFLVWSVAAVVMLGVDPPGTVSAPASSRVIGWAFREASFVSVTVVLLYVGNLREHEFPQAKLVRQLGWFFIWTVAGGLLGLVAPTFEFTSVFELVLPSSISSNPFVQALVHPTAAQLQEVLDTATPRPAAPFGYTNTWGYHLTVLGVWFAAGWLLGRRAGVKLLSAAVLLVGAIVLVFSLNRGAWIGVALGLAVVVIRLARYRKLLPLVVTLAASAVVGMLLAASPLLGLVEARLDQGHSDDIRAFTTERALELSSQSPVIGYGSTRQTLGSSSSIAVGKSADCPSCGNASIGMNGYFFMLLMSTGWVGAGLFYAFGISQAWRARGDPSPYATAAVAVLVMTAFYGLVYDIANWLLVPAIAIAILWRGNQQRVDAARPDSQPDGHAT